MEKYMKVFGQLFIGVAIIVLSEAILVGKASESVDLGVAAGIFFMTLLSVLLTVGILIIDAIVKTSKK